MKKKTQSGKPAPNEKGFLALAGEAFHVLGEEIIEGKDKVVETAAEKFNDVKKAIKRITHKKEAPAKRVIKKIVKKTPSKKSPSKKSPSKKSPSKKATPKKVIKKTGGKNSGISKRTVK
ncbi:hypothetical protein ACX0G9_01905 [Flavitalea flava]